MSRRFGEDKTLAILEGQALISWVAEGARRISDDVMVIAKDTAKYAFLALPTYEDIASVQCPLVGLLTAFEYARYDRVFMISADMPCFNFDAVKILKEQMERADADLAVPKINGKYYSTAAIYHKRTEQVYAKMFLKKDYKLMNAFPSLNVCMVEDFSAYDRDGAMFINVNTQEDLARLEAIRNG